MRAECDYRIGSPLQDEGRAVTLTALLGKSLALAAALRAALDAYSPGESLSGAEYRVTGR